GGTRLLARAGVAVERAALDGLVDRLDQVEMGRSSVISVATVGNSRLEATEVGLDRRRVAAVLLPLTLSAKDALLLGVDVGHKKGAEGRASAAAYYSALVKVESAEQPQAQEARRGRRLARNTAIFSIATGLSRIAGLV